MTYHPAAHMASAERRRFIEIPQSDVPALTGAGEPTNPKSLKDADTRRYAQYVWQVNPSPVTISGDVDADLSDLEDINQDLLNNALTGIIDPALSTVAESDGNLTWVGESLAGTDRTTALWRVKQIETTVSGSITYTQITWADGNGNFDNTATYPLSSHIFS